MPEEDYRSVRNRHENLKASIQQLVFMITIHHNRQFVVLHSAANMLGVYEEKL